MTLSHHRVVTEEWAWGNVLVYLKTRGHKSKTALKALHEAMKMNPHVLELLLGDIEITSEGNREKEQERRGQLPGT